MTEEIIINEKSLQAVLKRCDELEQENKELKIKLSSTKCYLCGEGFLTPEGAELYDEKERYRSALEEINITVKQLLQGVTSNCINNTPYLTALSLIENKINEVLNDK